MVVRIEQEQTSIYLRILKKQTCRLSALLFKLFKKKKMMFILNSVAKFLLAALHFRKFVSFTLTIF